MAKMPPFSVQCQIQSLRETVQLEAHLKMASHCPTGTSSDTPQNVHLPKVKVNMRGNEKLHNEKRLSIQEQYSRTSYRQDPYGGLKKPVKLKYTMTGQDESLPANFT